MFIAVDLKVIEGLAGAVARAASVSEDRILAGLVRLWHRCWVDEVDHLEHDELAGIFGFEGLDRIVVSLCSFGFLVALDSEKSWRVKGASRYLRLKESRRRGAQATNAKLGRPRATHKDALERRLSDAQRRSLTESPNTESPNTEEKHTGPHPKELAEVWNDYRPEECPTVKADCLSPGRMKSARARLKDRPDLEAWVATVARLRGSDFCRGLTKSGTWVATFDWLLRPDTATKIDEGSYDGQQSAGFDPNQGILSHG